jgi:hypothetical protein
MDGLQNANTLDFKTYFLVKYIEFRKHFPWEGGMKYTVYLFPTTAIRSYHRLGNVILSPYRQGGQKSEMDSTGLK